MYRLYGIPDHVSPIPEYEKLDEMSEIEFQGGKPFIHSFRLKIK